MGRKLFKWGGRFGILLISLVFWGLGFGGAFAGDQVSRPQTRTADQTADPKIQVPAFSKDRQFDFSLSAGMRSDSLDWSISGTPAGTNPNVISELAWSNVDSYQVTLANRSRISRHLYFRGAFNYAWIQDGTVRDSDYDGDNRTFEWSRSISESSGDEMWDVSAAGGYAFILLNDRLMVAPLLGLSYHKQNLRITNGLQVLSERSPAPPIGPLSSQLNSSYFARWAGPWIGCDLRYLTGMRGADFLTMEFGFSVEWHYADYYGEGNWNLRSDLGHPKSFEHEADGSGISISGEWLFTVAQNWDLSFAANYQYWSTGSGTDRKFLAAGGTAVTKLNEVKWTSSSFMVGANYQF